jgi:hypothetical protein
MHQMTANQLRPYLDWLAGIDKSLVLDAGATTTVGVESMIEAMLWRMMGSFLEGPVGRLTAYLRRGAPAIQYINFPFYSHFKSLYPGDSWIRRYPFFLGAESCITRRDVLRRYALLHLALTTPPKPFDFTLTGFSGNEIWGLRTPPQYVTIRVTDCSSGQEPDITTVGPHATHFNLVATVPAAKALPAIASSSDVSGFEEMLTVAVQNCSAMGDQLNSGRCASFWDAFERYKELGNPGRSVFEQLTQYADLVSGHVAGRIASLPALELHEDNPKNKEKVSDGLARFIAWNHALGFSNIVYCPYRTVEPAEDQTKTRMVSWGGVIIVLSDGDSLNKVTERLQSNLSDDSEDDPITSLVSNIRIFVDLATPKAIVGDWKYYQRTMGRLQMSKSHAQAVGSGLQHELRNLGDDALLSLPRGAERDALTTNISISVGIAKLIWEAYERPQEEVTLTDLMERLRLMFRWPDVALEDYGVAASMPDVRVRLPLIYALAELCRNAYKHGYWQAVTGRVEADMASKKTVIVEFKAAKGRLSEVRVLNPTRKPDSRFDGSSQAQNRGHLKGRNLVSAVVRDLLRGRFIFEVQAGHAIASISF